METRFGRPLGRLGRSAGKHAVSGGELHGIRLSEVTPEMIRETFPDWRVFTAGGIWWAIRCGAQALDGPESLLRRVADARTPALLAEKLCLQEWLDGLDPGELAAVWRDSVLPAVTA